MAVKPARKKSMRQVQKERTLQLLVKSSLALFYRKGYGSTTVHEIAEAAGVTRQTFYLHFPRKWHVLQHFLEEHTIPEAIEYYRRLDQLDGCDRGAVRAWLNDALDFFERHKKVLALHRQARSMEPEADHYNVAILRQFVDVMPNYRNLWGPDKEAFAKLRLNVLTVQLDDAAIWLSRGEEGITKDLVVDVLLDYWMVGLSGPS